MKLKIFVSLALCVCLFFVPLLDSFAAVPLPIPAMPPIPLPEIPSQYKDITTAAVAYEQSSGVSPASSGYPIGYDGTAAFFQWTYQSLLDFCDFLGVSIDSKFDTQSVLYVGNNIVLNQKNVNALAEYCDYLGNRFNLTANSIVNVSSFAVPSVTLDDGLIAFFNISSGDLSSYPTCGTNFAFDPSAFVSLYRYDSSSNVYYLTFSNGAKIERRIRSYGSGALYQAIYFLVSADRSVSNPIAYSNSASSVSAINFPTSLKITYFPDGLVDSNGRSFHFQSSYARTDSQVVNGLAIYDDVASVIFDNSTFAVFDANLYLSSGSSVDFPTISSDTESLSLSVPGNASTTPAEVVEQVESNIPVVSENPIDIPAASDNISASVVDSLTGIDASTAGIQSTTASILDNISAFFTDVANLAVEIFRVPFDLAHTLTSKLKAWLDQFGDFTWNIWHYVVEWIQSLSAGFAWLKTVWGLVPSAITIPVFAGLVIVLVLGTYRRFWS